MMKCYIEFFYENQVPIARIYKDGKIRVVRNKNNLLKLLEICKEYGYLVEDECVIKEDAFSIAKEYERFMNKQKKLRVIGNISSNMKLSRKNAALGKIVVASTIVALLATYGISRKNIIKNNINEYQTPNIYTQQESLQQETLEPEIETTSSQTELAEMIRSDTFSYSYENRCNSDEINNARRYDDIFQKYANRYGIDKNLIMAMAAQESSGQHFTTVDSDMPAAGIMQIEKNIWLGKTISAYNFETQEVDTYLITEDALHDIDSNIQIGTMILRSILENYNYNIPLSTQAYNFGMGNMRKSLAMCSDLKNIEVNDMINDCGNNQWLSYRSFLNTGDSRYVEHVFSFLNPDTTITVQKRDGSLIGLNIINESCKNITY